MRKKTVFAPNAQGQRKEQPWFDSPHCPKGAPDELASPPSATRKRPRHQTIARFLVRVSGDRRWTWEPSYEAMLLIEKALKNSWRKTASSSIFRICERRTDHHGDRPLRERAWRRDHERATKWEVAD